MPYSRCRCSERLFFDLLSLLVSFVMSFVIRGAFQHRHACFKVQIQRFACETKGAQRGTDATGRWRGRI